MLPWPCARLSSLDMRYTLRALVMLCAALCSSETRPCREDQVHAARQSSARCIQPPGRVCSRMRRLLSLLEYSQTSMVCWAGNSRFPRVRARRMEDNASMDRCMRMCCPSHVRPAAVTYCHARAGATLPCSVDTRRVSTDPSRNASSQITMLSPRAWHVSCPGRRRDSTAYRRPRESWESLYRVWRRPCVQHGCRSAESP